MNSLQLQFLMLIFAGWVNRSQQDVIEYLQEENRVLREQLGGRRSRFTDGQRRRLAAKAKAIGRKGLFEISNLVTPDTLLRWYRRLIAKKYDRSKCRTAGRSTQNRCRDRGTGRADGAPESNLGLHTNSGCTLQPRSRDRP